MPKTPSTSSLQPAQQCSVLRMSLDHYSLAMQRCKDMLKRIPTEHHQGPLPPIKIQHDIQSRNKRTELLHVRAARLERLHRHLTETKPGGQAEGNAPRLAPHLRLLSEPSPPGEQHLKDGYPAPPLVRFNTATVMYEGNRSPQERDICGSSDGLINGAERMPFESTANTGHRSNVYGDAAPHSYEQQVAPRHCGNGNALLLSEADVYLIMHLWERFPALGHKLSLAVRTLRSCRVSTEHLEDGSWRELCSEDIDPVLVDLMITLRP